MAGDNNRACMLKSTRTKAGARARVSTAQRWVIDVLLPVPFWMMVALGGGAANSVS